jgi:hypothetical protein
MTIMGHPLSNPLHLLDDFFASIPSLDPIPATAEDQSDYDISHHEHHHDLTLRVAADLFRNITSLLENALSLLEEQEQCQRQVNPNHSSPIIRTIRSERSGRQAILIRKQRKNKHPSESIDDATKGDFYVCLLGREKTDTVNQVHRRSMHCTCRSFLNNVKGGGRKGGSNTTADGPNIICKHLLAVILMPHLMPWSVKGVPVEILEDRMFAKLIASCQI